MLQKEIPDFVRRAYFANFRMLLGDHIKLWAPHAVCTICYSLLPSWTNKIPNRHLRFGTSMVWHEPSNHTTDCYFCLVETKSFSWKNRHKIKYPNLPPAILPVPHPDLHPVPIFRELSPLQILPFCALQQNSGKDIEQPDSEVQIDDKFDDETCKSYMSAESNVKYSLDASSPISVLLPLPMNQIELNDPIRDLKLSKDHSQVLASRLKERNLLTHGTSMSYYISRETSFR